MRTNDRFRKTMFLILTIAAVVLSVRLPPAVSSAAAESSSRNRQYTWGVVGGYPKWVGTSDDANGKEGLGFELSLADIEELVAKQARKGWTVKAIEPVNRGYFVLFEK